MTMKEKLSKEWEKIKVQEQSDRKLIHEFLALLTETDNPIKVKHYWNELAKAVDMLKVILRRKDYLDQLSAFSLSERDDIREIEREIRKEKRAINKNKRKRKK